MQAEPFIPSLYCNTAQVGDLLADIPIPTLNNTLYTSLLSDPATSTKATKMLVSANDDLTTRVLQVFESMENVSHLKLKGVLHPNQMSDSLLLHKIQERSPNIFQEKTQGISVTQATVTIKPSLPFESQPVLQQSNSQTAKSVPATSQINIQQIASSNVKTFNKKKRENTEITPASPVKKLRILADGLYQLLDVTQHEKENSEVAQPGRLSFTTRIVRILNLTFLTSLFSPQWDTTSSRFSST